MRLAEFILANIERILQAWEDFARSLPPGTNMTVPALRDDAERMLRFIALDMETRQSARQQFQKSIGAGPQPTGSPSAAQDHGFARAVDRFSLPEMVSEYRALRASVLSLWLNTDEADEEMQQVIRFNEAVDQIIAESVARFSSKLEGDADVFTASIGHDLRNPLNAIAMSAELLESGSTLSEELRTAASRQIRQSAMRMAAMLGELQDFSRVRLSAMSSFPREPGDVADLCEQVVSEIAAARPDRQVEFERAGDTIAFVNPERIRQLASNLVANAVEYSADTVRVSVRGEAESALIEVHSRGAVIQPGALDKVFDPLFRTDASDPNREHLGLGLHIVRTIALAHGGNVGVTSNARDGTTFCVRLPRETASP